MSVKPQRNILHSQKRGRSFKTGMGGTVDICLGVLRDSFLNKISFPLKGYHIHEVEWIGSVVVLVTV